MSSKQEKLAAARKKLKEFQGKNRESESSKHKNIADFLPQTFPKNPLQSSDNSSLHHSFSLEKNTENFDKNSENSFVKSDQEKFDWNNYTQKRKFSDSLSNKSSSPISWPEGNQQFSHNLNRNKLPGSPLNFQEIAKGDENIQPKYYLDSHNGLSESTPNIKPLVKYAENVQDFTNSYNVATEKLLKDQLKPFPDKVYSNLSSENVNLSQNLIEQKSSLNEVYSNSALDNVVKPLQEQLQNHTQTINILVQQRNEAQNALVQAQNLLTEKSGEIERLNRHILEMNSATSNLSQRLLDAEETIKYFNLEKEENLKSKHESKAAIDDLKAQLDSRNEECSELRKKFREKEKECQDVLSDLQKTQSQLSLCQIEIQQFSAGEQSALSSRITELKNENWNLKQKIEDFQKKIDTVNIEKEQASQNFHTYAQQCSSQLSSLNSQLNSLIKINEKLKEENAVLNKNLLDLEDQKKITPSEIYETEKENLLSQINKLKEENKNLGSSLMKKEEELTTLHKQLDEKDVTLQGMECLVKELESENVKLNSELETPKANERLLATMESDKVAAAKAVSQNQKLKEQVIELENAFMKLSQEKLELTDQLTHEKHINSELEKKIKDSEHNHSHHHHDHDHNHDHSSECHHGDSDKIEPLINDSNEVEELRNIVRQLQDDKIQLTARLNTLTSNKVESSVNNIEKETSEDYANDNNIEGENAKLLLRQMEEKVRKTMNEIAILDEEKEKLEHLVLQLQGETETIGEYVALYQKQRMMLRQRAQEKDNQLMQLSRDKEELRSKLSALDELVQHLLAEKQNITSQPGQVFAPVPETSENTAGKIRDLINEIGSTTLVNSHSVAFEHCSCCSGRLIVI